MRVAPPRGSAELAAVAADAEFGASFLVQSALLVADFGRAAARAAADRVVSSVRPADALGGTGVPSGSASLVTGEPVSTPAGMCDVSEALGGNRRGGFTLSCAEASSGTANASDNERTRLRSDDRFTDNSISQDKQFRRSPVRRASDGAAS